MTLFLTLYYTTQYKVIRNGLYYTGSK